MNKDRLVLPLASIILLAACGSPDAQSETTGAEERELDEAAAALDATQADYQNALQTAEPDLADGEAEDAEQ